MTPRTHASIVLRQAGWLLAAAGALAFSSAQAADTDIYAPSGGSGIPNVVFLLDNTANWSGMSQNWNAHDAYNAPTIGCKNRTPASAVEACKTLITQIYYAGVASPVYPWDSAYQANKNNVKLTQGQVQLRAIKLVLNSLVCSGATTALQVNLGIAMLGDSGSVLSISHSTGFIRYAVRELNGTATTSGSSCKLLMDGLDTMFAEINSPAYKTPASANYGAAMYEIFKYFGGYSNPARSSTSPSTAGAPVGATGYGPIRYSKLNTLDDPAAFTDSGRTTYKSPITAANSCGTNYIVLVGNGYPDAEPKNGGPTVFNSSNLAYTPPTLSPVSSDTTRYADEWAQFLANSDVSPVDGVQRIFTYTINTFKDKPEAGQAKLLKSMASVGGIGAGGYLEVGGDLVALVDAFKEVISNIAAVNSVFAATTLPVSTTTQGTYLNQIFVGMFRPDKNRSPRWVGNLKQYQFGRSGTGDLDLVDSVGNSAVLAGSGFFAPGAKSFWSEDSVFFTNGPSGTPPSASDWPDGAIVEKGGVAQMLRKANAANSGSRNVYTLPNSPSGGVALSVTPFNGSNDAVTGYPFTADEIKWVRGENNSTSVLGGEEFNGAYLSGTTVTDYGATGPRHSIHGDVLHSQPVALNYGGEKVVVYYGANDGFVRAVDGQKTTASSSTAGQELWSFIAPEHYGILKRLRDGSPKLHLPETDKDGKTIPPADGSAVKQYGMDGPIGVFAAYASGGASGVVSVNEAIIYPTMRRGGRTVYALDVTSPTGPKFKWKITGGVTDDFSRLAQTWSKPKPIIFPSSVSADPIIVMGGGYDPAEDTNSSSDIGNRVYAINGRTGRLLKALTTDFSVPSDVTVVDTNFDGVPDRGYVADVRGNLYRINMTDDQGRQLDPNNWTIVKIAALGGKVFFAPDVVATKSFVAVLTGTGDREKPLLVSTNDNFVLVKDKLIGQDNRSRPLALSDLTRVAKVANADDDGWSLTDVNSNPVSANGCYLQLATNGEKVVNAPFTIAGATYFSTNRPKPNKPNVCSADLGITRAYKFPLFCTSPTATKIDGGGLPPSPVGGLVTLRVGNKDVLTSFLNGAGKNGSVFRPEEPRPPVSPVRTRQNWRIDNSNR